MPFTYLSLSLINGERAGDNPWHARGLEWQTSSPPPKRNFRTPPRIDREPYDYDVSAEPPEPKIGRAQ
jgi:cytochrome c oxidase subunit 1